MSGHWSIRVVYTTRQWFPWSDKSPTYEAANGSEHDPFLCVERWNNMSMHVVYVTRHVAAVLVTPPLSGKYKLIRAQKWQSWPNALKFVKNKTDTHDSWGPWLVSPFQSSASNREALWLRRRIPGPWGPERRANEQLQSWHLSAKTELKQVDGFFLGWACCRKKRLEPPRFPTDASLTGDPNPHAPSLIQFRRVLHHQALPQVSIFSHLLFISKTPLLTIAQQHMKTTQPQTIPNPTPQTKTICQTPMLLWPSFYPNPLTLAASPVCEACKLIFLYNYPHIAFDKSWRFLNFWGSLCPLQLTQHLQGSRSKLFLQKRQG